VILIDALCEQAQEGKIEILRCAQRDFSKLPRCLHFHVTSRPDFDPVKALSWHDPKVIEPTSDQVRRARDISIERR
jgi:hypothetical protein